MCQHFVLGDQRSLGILGDHEAGVEARVMCQECRESAVKGGIEQTIRTAFADVCQL